jgi:hypothetical protein
MSANKDVWVHKIAFLRHFAKRILDNITCNMAYLLDDEEYDNFVLSLP